MSLRVFSYHRGDSFILPKNTAITYALCDPARIGLPELYNYSVTLGAIAYFLQPKSAIALT